MHIRTHAHTHTYTHIPYIMSPCSPAPFISLLFLPLSRSSGFSSTLQLRKLNFANPYQIREGSLSSQLLIPLPASPKFRGSRPVSAHPSEGSRNLFALLPLRSIRDPQFTAGRKPKTGGGDGAFCPELPRGRPLGSYWSPDIPQILPPCPAWLSLLQADLTAPSPGQDTLVE